MFLFLDLEVFVSRIFVSVDLHVGDVPFFGCNWNCDGLEGNISRVNAKLSFTKRVQRLPGQLQRNPGRVVNAMRGT